MRMIVLLTLFVCAPAQAATIDVVTARRIVSCGVVHAAADWNKDDFHGDLSALGREICRAAAAAVLGRADAVAVSAFPAEADALRALQSGQVDMVAGLTPSATRTMRDHVMFGPVFFWDGQGFLVHAAPGMAGLSALAGRTLCFLDGTDAAATVMAARASLGLRFTPFPFQEEGEMEAGLIGGHCSAVSAAVSTLAAMRAQAGTAAHDLILLPDLLSAVPLAMATRAGDSGWSAAMAAVIDVLVLAEMNGAAGKTGDDSAARQWLGADWSAAAAFGLPHDFAAREIAAVGDYGAVFARSVGGYSPLSLPRGINAVCTKGGAICAAPLR